MKIVLVTFISLIVCLSSIAQSIDNQQLADKRKYKNELAFDIKNISTNSFFRSIGIMYKKSYRKGDLIDVNLIKSRRFFINSFNVQYKFNGDSTQDSLQYVRDGFVNNTASQNGLKVQDDISFSLGFGLERQKSMDKIVLNWGLDLVFSYAMVEDDISNLNFANLVWNHTGTTDIRLRSASLGFNPFIGLKYFLTPRIAAGFETGIFVGFFDSAQIYYGGGPTLKSRGILTNYNGLRRLNISYIF